MRKSITLLGGGSWSTALAKLLSENGHDVMVWLRDKSQRELLDTKRENEKYLPGISIPKNIAFETDINKAVSGAEILLIATPTQSVRNILRQIDSKHKTGKIVVNVSKGIETATMCLISDIVNEETTGCQFAALTGPSHAEEVGLTLPTTVVVACKNKKIAKSLQNMFMSPYFRVYTSNDVAGAELGGALKNIIALGAGISDGVGYGDNTKAALINRGLFEITRLGTAMNADSHTLFGLSGAGDLIVTCTSRHSRNWQAGYLIGQGLSKDAAIKKVGMVVEGISTTHAAHQLAQKFDVEMPITSTMYNILEYNADIKETINKLMARDKKRKIGVKSFPGRQQTVDDSFVKCSSGLISSNFCDSSFSNWSLLLPSNDFLPQEVE